MYPEKITVSEIISQIKISLENDFKSVCVEGEITNLSKSANGHWYFSITDEQAILNCALFKINAQRNPQIVKFKIGEKVLCFGDISVYAPKGSFQLIVRQVLPVGIGDQKQKFELLKKKLGAEGFFDLEHKKKIPDYPKKIAVITSPTGAAIFDFLNIVKRRAIWMDILIIPAVVQGLECPASLIRALELACKYHQKSSIDLIVLTRGGGSPEDLGGFNDEGLASKIYQCEIPIISAVGHEVDYTICDLVADFRCETPSAAAELVTKAQLEIMKSMANSKNRILSALERKILYSKNRLESKRPSIYKDSILARFNSYQKRINRLNLSERANDFFRMDEKWISFDYLQKRFADSLTNKLREINYRLEEKYKILGAIDPKNVLKRGYALVQTEQERAGKKIISSKKEFCETEEQKLELVFHDGAVGVLRRKA